MKIKNSIFALSLALPLFAFANTSHASNKYTTCSNTQIAQLKPLIPLTTDEVFDDKNYQSCLVIDPDKQTFLVAKSKQILVEKDDNGNNIGGIYDLTLYLIDGLKNKILSQKLLADDISSDAIRFDGIELDTTPFSTLPNKTVIGVTQNLSHRGFLGIYQTRLDLIEITNDTILLRGGLLIEDSHSQGGGMTCPDIGGVSSGVKRILVLSDRTHNGLQDIVIKSKKSNFQFNPQTCEGDNRVIKTQRTAQFDGIKYRFKSDGLKPDAM